MILYKMILSNFFFQKNNFNQIIFFINFIIIILK